MNGSAPELDRRQLGPRPGCALFLIPTTVLLVVIGAYVFLYVKGLAGRPPEGDRVTMVFAGCSEALGVVRARVDAMGLGDPVQELRGDGFAITARLPADPDSVAAIPKTLAKTGRFEIRGGDSPDAPVIVGSESVEATSIYLGSTGAVTLVRLTPQGGAALRAHAEANHAGKVTFFLDGEAIGARSNMPSDAASDLEILGPNVGTKAQLDVAAERAILIDHGPLPCPIVLGEVVPE